MTPSDLTLIRKLIWCMVFIAGTSTAMLVAFLIGQRWAQ